MSTKHVGTAFVISGKASGKASGKLVFQTQPNLSGQEFKAIGSTSMGKCSCR